MPAEFIVVINPRIRLNFNFYFDANFFLPYTDMSVIVKFKRKIIIIKLFFHLCIFLPWLAGWLAGGLYSIVRTPCCSTGPSVIV